LTPFDYETPQTIHKVPFAPFTDQHVPDFDESMLALAIRNTEFRRIDIAGNVVETHTLPLDPNSLSFKALEGDYIYLMTWYYNEHRKSNTRHGHYIMLYLIGDTYHWKLNDAFVDKILKWFTCGFDDLFDLK